MLENSQQSVLSQTHNTSATIPFALSNPGHLINNLLNVFLSNPLLNEESNIKSQSNENYQESKRAVLSHLPRIVTSVALLWQHVAMEDPATNGSSLLGNRQILRKQLLELLSPISLHHNTQFIAAVGVAWNERKPSIIKTVKAISTKCLDSEILFALAEGLGFLRNQSLKLNFWDKSLIWSILSRYNIL